MSYLDQGLTIKETPQSSGELPVVNTAWDVNTYNGFLNVFQISILFLTIRHLALTTILKITR